MNSKELEQIKLVKKLVKSPSKIMSEMTKDKCQILHPTLGIVGEYLELSNGIKYRDRDNVIEELGDLLFYTIDLKIALGINMSFNPLDGTIVGNHIIESLLDAVKKFIIYNKELNRIDMFDYLRCIDGYILYIAEFFGFSIDKIRDHNIKKLNKRYKDGYSDQAAKERADKRRSNSKDV